MKSPKRYRFVKISKMGWRLKGSPGNHGGHSVGYGDYGLLALEPGRLSVRQIEAARRTIRHVMDRSGGLWIRLHPSVPVTKKPIEVRMGGGKGSRRYWSCRVKPGVVIFEIFGVPRDVAFHALLRGSVKLPIKCKVVSRPEGSVDWNL